MSEEALENYGEEWRGVTLLVDSAATSVKQHRGYDEGVYPCALYDLHREDTGEGLQFSLYDWELKPSGRLPNCGITVREVSGSLSSAIGTESQGKSSQ
jgi:hypothetical protein